MICLSHERQIKGERVGELFLTVNVEQSVSGDMDCSVLTICRLLQTELFIQGDERDNRQENERAQSIYNSPIVYPHVVLTRYQFLVVI